MEILEMKNMLTNVKNTLHRLTDLGWQRKKVNEYKKNRNHSIKKQSKKDGRKINRALKIDLPVQSSSSLSSTHDSLTNLTDDCIPHLLCHLQNKNWRNLILVFSAPLAARFEPVTHYGQ